MYLGSVYIAGATDGDLDGPLIGTYDGFVAKFSESVPTPGDANGDGKVDGNDYLTWAGFYGDDPARDPPGAPANGDFNNDDVVDALDYLIWAGNYGQGPNAAVSVPEPAGLPLALLASVI